VKDHLVVHPSNLGRMLASQHGGARWPSTDDLGRLRNAPISHGWPRRARMIWSASQERRVPTLAKLCGIKARTARTWLTRLIAHGGRALEEGPRSVPPRAPLPRPWARPFGPGCARLAPDRTAQKGLPSQRRRSAARLLAAGRRGRPHDTWWGERGEPAGAPTRGPWSPSLRPRRRATSGAAWLSWAPSRPRACLALA
jgi:hypothetical protein